MNGIFGIFMFFVKCVCVDLSDHFVGCCHIFTCLRMPNVSMVPCPICAIQLKITYF